jgi:L-ascorbate metabolism protein UlaG (beta-lactamase superfamily)
VVLHGKKLLFDPFISPNELAASIDVNKVEADYILVSHGHADHIADCVSIATRTGAKVISSWEIHEWLQKQGIANTHPMNTGGKWEFEFGVVKCVVAQHSSGLPDGSYGGSPMGFVIRSEGGNFYYSGDTALTIDMQLIPSFCTLDFCILPVGDNFTMGIEDASRAAHMVNCNKVIGVHFDTFGYIRIDHDKAFSHFTRNNLELILPKIGATFEF